MYILIEFETTPKKELWVAQVKQNSEYISEHHPISVYTFKLKSQM
jgi:hypothetical protein